MGLKLTKAYQGGTEADRMSSGDVAWNDLQAAVLAIVREQRKAKSDFDLAPEVQ